MREKTSFKMSVFYHKKTTKTPINRFILYKKFSRKQKLIYIERDTIQSLPIEHLESVTTTVVQLC